ncbi:hypothetical protein REPUB_Repub14bG0026200 [Reevesia pubescens]
MANLVSYRTGWDKRKTLIGSQLWWNWELDTTKYPGWQELVKDLSTDYIKVMTYCNPCLALMDDKPNKRRNLFEEAKELVILVKYNHEEPYMAPNTAFDVGMLDLTHPLTTSWFKQILQEMMDDGVRRWMADFGEGLPVDAVLYSVLHVPWLTELSVFLRWLPLDVARMWGRHWLEPLLAPNSDTTIPRFPSSNYLSLPLLNVLNIASALSKFVNKVVDGGITALHMPKRQDEDAGYDELNGASFTVAVFNLSTTIVGAGIMALPATMKVMGLILRIAIIIFMAFLN